MHQVSVTTAKMPLTSQFRDHRIALGSAGSRANKYIGAVLDKSMREICEAATPSDVVRGPSTN